ncbi:MAG: RAMP superfamily CRISPR-associated protein [Infirmifilum sp.]
MVRHELRDEVYWKVVFHSQDSHTHRGVREGNFLYILRLSDGRLIIPASSWKGALRALAERLATSMPLSVLERLALQIDLSDDPRRSAEPLLTNFREALTGKSSPPFTSEDVKRILLDIGYREVPGDVDDPLGALVEYLSYYTPTGRLFGNRVRAASLRFFDTILNTPTQRRPGVGIDRKTLTVKENVLYQVEATEPGIRVPLVLVGEVERVGSAPAKLLASTLEAVKEVGLSIGARKSAGLGLLELEHAEFHVVKVGKEGDARGALLANPLKARPTTLENFTAILRGHSEA